MVCSQRMAVCRNKSCQGAETEAMTRRAASIFMKAAVACVIAIWPVRCAFAQPQHGKGRGRFTPVSPSPPTTTWPIALSTDEPNWGPEEAASSREEGSDGGSEAAHSLLPRPDLNLPRMDCPLTNIVNLVSVVARKSTAYRSQRAPSAVSPPAAKKGKGGGSAAADDEAVVEGEEDDSTPAVDALGRSVKFVTSPYTADEAADGRHPSLWSAGNTTHTFALQGGDAICGFRPFANFDKVYQTYFLPHSSPSSHSVLQNRTVLFMGDSVIRNQMMAAVAAACNPYLFSNCSHKYLHAHNVDPNYSFTTDFPNGPIQCFLNGTEVGSFLPGGVAFQQAHGDNSPKLPRDIDTATAACINRCRQRIRVREVVVPGVTHSRKAFTREEKRRQWHVAFPAPMLEITFVESNTRFINIQTHCHRKSNFGAILVNLASAKRLWPPQWNKTIDLVVANGGLHCEKRSLVGFYKTLPWGMRALRKATNGHDGRPTELIYMQQPMSYLYREASHAKVDTPFMLANEAVVIDATIEEADGHVFPARFFTEDQDMCVYSDPLHSNAICATSLSTVLCEGIRYVFSKRSEVGGGGVAEVSAKTIAQGQRLSVTTAAGAFRRQSGRPALRSDDVRTGSPNPHTGARSNPTVKNANYLFELYLLLAGAVVIMLVCVSFSSKRWRQSV